MKKTIFSLIAFLSALLCVLSACDLLSNEPPQTTVDETQPPVEKPSGKTTYTLRIADDDDNGGGSIGIGFGNVVSTGAANELANSRSESRALTTDNAIASHEFFEVVFVFNDGGTHRVARTTWNIGETPELRGVHKGAAANYSNTAFAFPAASGQGSALLFTGTKNDKTLLGLGRIVDVDGTTVAGIFTIPTNARSVTFEVYPILAGITNSATTSSFTTTSHATTILNNIFIHYNYRTPIPMFQLTANTVYGQYDFKTPIATGAGSFNTFKAGIILAGTPPPSASKISGNIETRNPRYIVTDGQYNYSSMLVQDTKTQAEFQNNYYSTVDAPFENPVTFRFSNVEGFIETPPQSPLPDPCVFALCFELFVYNLTALPTTMDNSAAVKWRISPGIGNRWLDLDGGNGGEGGAVFLGSGNVAAWLTNLPGAGAN